MKAVIKQEKLSVTVHMDRIELERLILSIARCSINGLMVAGMSREQAETTIEFWRVLKDGFEK